MATTDLTLHTMQRLIFSRVWQHYVDWLLAQYDQVSERLDHSEHDQRYLQGMKHGLRLALETPYRVAEVESPLRRPEPRRPRRLPGRAEAAAPEGEVPALRRRSFLA